MPRYPRYSIALLIIGVVGCHGSPTEPTTSSLRLGRWAGPQVEVAVSGTQVVLNTTSCVRGFFGRPTVGFDGRFVADAGMQSMFGPPPQPPFPHARIDGVVRDETLVITATYDNGTKIGPLTATYLAAGPTFYPCPP